MGQTDRYIVLSVRRSQHSSAFVFVWDTHCIVQNLPSMSLIQSCCLFLHYHLWCETEAEKSHLPYDMNYRNYAWSFVQKYNVTKTSPLWLIILYLFIDHQTVMCYLCSDIIQCLSHTFQDYSAAIHNRLHSCLNQNVKTRRDCPCTTVARCGFAKSPDVKKIISVGSLLVHLHHCTVYLAG